MNMEIDARPIYLYLGTSRNGQPIRLSGPRSHVLKTDGWPALLAPSVTQTLSMHTPSALHSASIMRIPLRHFETKNPFDILERLDDKAYMPSAMCDNKSEFFGAIEEASFAVIEEDNDLISLACTAMIEEIRDLLIFQNEVRRLGSLADEEEFSTVQIDDYLNLCQLACAAMASELEYDREVSRILAMYDGLEEPTLSRSSSIIILKHFSSQPLTYQLIPTINPIKMNSPPESKLAKMKRKSKQVWGKIRCAFGKIVRPKQVRT